MISQQPRSRIERQCGLAGENGTAYEPFVGNEVQCNCSSDPRGGVYLEKADPSNRFVGRAPVVLPYLYYVRVNGSHEYVGEEGRDEKRGER